MKSIGALTISNDSICAAIIAEPFTSKPVIKKYKMLPLPHGAVVDGEATNRSAVTGLIKNMVKYGDLPKEDVYMVYSSRRMIFREASFPEMPLPELRETLPFQAKDKIALPVNESLLDFVPIRREETQGGAFLHGLIVATLSNGVEHTAQAVEEAGVTIESIDASAFSLARLFSGQAVDHAAAVVNIGGNSTDVVIIDHTRLAYMRVVPSGGDDVTDAISNSIGVTYEQALEIKRHIGLQNVVGDARLEKAEEAIRETIAQLVVGIRNTLNSYDQQHAQSPVTEVLLTGPGSVLVGLPPVLASSIGKVVKIADPFAPFELSQEAKDQNMTVHAADYAVVLGLALGRRPR